MTHKSKSPSESPVRCEKKTEWYLIHDKELGYAIRRNKTSKRCKKSVVYIRNEYNATTPYVSEILWGEENQIKRQMFDIGIIKYLQEEVYLFPYCLNCKE